MTFKRMVLSAVSASGILLAISGMAPIGSMTSQAQAATNISVNFGFGSFYDGLQPYGDWVFYQGDYVFLPRHVGYGWRPYTLGHWSYTQRYGWLWVSNERFGWATYHYGRWGYSPDIGWYWVPGRRWAPAWVAWSRGDDDVAWAPLPPRRGDDVDINITIGDVPDFYWQAVPTSAFISINLSDRIIRDRNRVRTIVQQRPPETVRIENNVVINNVIRVDDIEKASNKRVKVLEARPVDNPNAAGKTDPNSVAIFNPDVPAGPGAKPRKPVKIDQVITDRKMRNIPPLDTQSDQGVVSGQTTDKNAQPMPQIAPPKGQLPADGKTTSGMPRIDKGKPPMPIDGGKMQSDSQGNVIIKKKKDVKPFANEPPPVMKSPDVKAPPSPGAEAPIGKPKRDKGLFNQPMNGDNGNPPLQKFNKNKSGGPMPPKVDQKTFQPDQKGQPPQGQDNLGKKPRNVPGKVECDPNVQTCPPAQ